MKTIHCFLVAALSLGLSVLQTIAAPTVTSVLPAPGTVSALAQVTVNFSGPVANVVASDLLLNGFPLAGSVTGGGAAYTFILAEQPAYGTVAVSWDTGHNITDAGGAMERFNENGAGATWQYTFIDTVSPTVVGLTPSAGASVRALTQVDVQFNEAVTGVEAADLLVNNVPASGLSALGAGSYRFTFAQPANGQVQMAWAGSHGIRDLASPANNFAGGAWSYTLNPSLGLPALRINEFVAANISGLVDENNEQQDWIEIWNYGASPVNLNGFSLTDDPDLPGKWVFPSTNLAAGQFLVVLASEKDRRVITNAAHRLHTNFKLNPGGEYLGLFNSESPRVAISEFAPEYPEQRNNYSYGYDAGGDLKYFLTPTPGAANGTSTIASILPAPHFNVSRGLFDQPFELILSSSVPGATIRYTVDGSEPTESAGLIYSTPLTISNTAVLRAVAFKANSLPSATVTHSYFFIDQIVQQPAYPTGFPTNWGCCGNINDVSSTATFPPASTVPGVVPADYEMDMDPLRVDPNNTNSAIDAVKMQRLKDGLREIPTLSIVMKVDDIFGTNGLHQRSADETGSPGTKPDNKKPCSVELILPNGETAFATTCGIDLHGNASRNPIKNPKHGFKLNFRGDFGPTTLQYKLFEDSTVEEFDDILLRADFNSSWRHWSDTAGQGLGGLQRTRAVRTRDAWMKDSMREMGGLASHNRFVHLYLNGLYWGTYDISEDTSPIFAKNALGGSEEDYDVVDQGLVKNGTTAAYSAMTALPAATTLAAYEQYNQYLNVPEFIDYMVLHFFMGHQDWGDAITKNWAAVRKRVAGSEGTFRYLPWDGECILLNEDVNRVTAANPPSGLHTKLDDSPEYRLAFADRVHRSLVAPGGALTPSMNIARWQKWQAVMDKPIVAESVRWGDYRRDVHRYSEGVYQLYTRENHWLAEHARMLGYFSNRNATVLTQLRNASMYPTVSAPVFNQQGGLAARGFNLTMTATNPVYYTLDGTDPRVYGTGAVSPGAALYAGAITLSNSIVIKARALIGTNWSALNQATFSVDSLASPLRITEIMYNPIGGDAYEFIEIKNVGTLPFNVGNYTIDGVDFVFPPNTVLAPGQVIVLGSDAAPTLWTDRYPGVAVFGRFGGRLDNGGERLGFRQGTTPFALVWSVDYNDESGWPLAADGQGASLEMIDPFGDPDDATNWRASAAANGTPGIITPPPTPSTSIVINEIVADNGLMPSVPGIYPDWIELYNRGSQTVNLANWSLSDNSNPRRFVFPATNVPPGGYVFAWMGAAFVSDELVIPFGLGSGGGGENLFLYDANTNLIDSIGFGFQLTNYSLGRVNNQWALTQPTPKTANVAASLAAVSNLSINEWLANPDSGDDWIELHNRGAAPVALRGIFLGAGTGLGQIKSLSFLAPGGFVQFLADGNSGVNNLPFSLPAVGGTIVLYAESGVEIDRVTYGPQAQGVTQGRLPDGAPNITSFPASPSPSASNYLFNYTGPTLNEVLAINDAAVVNAAGRTADFVELRNPNGAPFDVSGMRLSTDPEDASQWTIPAGVSIPANGHLVIWFDDERPASLVNEAVLNTGRSLDGDSDEVWLFNSVGQPVDSVVFGFQVADKPIGRNGSSWDLLIAPTPGNANAGPAPLGSPLGLRINEWQASPVSGNDWFEIYNTNTQPVALAGLYLADNPSAAGLTQFPIPPLSFIGGKGFVECIADGEASQGRNHVNFSLEASGEVLRIVSPSLGVIDTVGFGLQQTGVSEGRVPDGGETVVAFGTTPTPGASNYRPLAGPVINEVLSYPSASTLENAIELYNPTGQGIDLSGWYLGDSAANAKKYRIADGTFLPAGGYLVFYDAQLGAGGPFNIDAYGGQVLLSEADAAGNLTGNRSVARFQGALAGVSFGRVETCAGADFVLLSARTFGQDTPISLAQFRTGTGLFNAPPRVGPVVINEIMYHPPDDGTNDNTIDEYIELHNFSASPVQLFDPFNPANTWQLREGVRFNFPNNVSIPAGGHVLIVSFDPVSNASQASVFRTKYGVPPGVSLFGPYSGRLDNGGERVELYQPVPPPGGSAGTPFVLVDRIEYGDAAPWPTTSDGAGDALQRVTASAFGNDAANWSAASPTAGAANPSHPAVAPTISAQPIGRAVPPGSRVVFNVGVCGNRPLTYQWKRNGNNITDATNASHVIPSAQAGNAGDYTVLVSNSAGSVLSAVASLSLVAPPVITAQPTPQNVAGGMPATFSVVATGSAPLTYQWRRNGLPIAGATNATLMLESVRRADAGDYSVLVGNAAGAIASVTARLTVLVPPTITAQPQNQSVTPGSSATFSVTATGVGTLRYQWQFNGVDIPGATGASFTTNNVQLANEGNYRVLVSDDVTTGASAVARLTVRVAPLVLSSSPGVTNVVGSTITMSVVGSGSVPMGFIWRRGATGVITNVLMTTSNSFTITNAQVSDTATWRVILTNSGNLSLVVNTTFVIRVVAPPQITGQPTNQVVNRGANATFATTIGGTAPFQYQWRFNGSDLPGATNATLTVTNVQFANLGSYQVFVSNLAGNDLSQPATLSLVPEPTLSELTRLGDGTVQMRIFGPTNRSYAIEASSTLTNWTTLNTIFYTNGLMPLTDSTAVALPHRFYRARLVP